METKQKQRFFLCDGEYFLTQGGLIAEVRQDGDAYSPREEEENIGKLFVRDRSPLGSNETELKTWADLCRKYGVQESGQMSVDIQAVLKNSEAEGDIILPLSTYSHSGTTVYEGAPSDHFDGRWDCTFEGFLMTDKKTIEKEFGKRKDARETAKACLRSEIKMLDAWLQGEIYGCTEYSVRGEEDDTCWGFYGDDPDRNGMDDMPGGRFTEKLGRYGSIEECIEQNAKKLGIVITPLPAFSERVYQTADT